MCKDVLITGVTVALQKSRANHILHNQVIPREELFQIRKKQGRLSPELLNALESNA